MATKKAALACTVCGSRNYAIMANHAQQNERLQVKKYCKYCKQHTVHKETK